MIETLNQIREHLAENPLAGLTEVVHVTATFRADRKRSDGRPQKVTVTIRDAGPDADPLLRFHCEARGDDGSFATGNPADTVEMAIMDVDWHDLDEKAEAQEQATEPTEPPN